MALVLCGQTNTMIGYQLGLSKGRISTLLRSAMRKVGVRSRVQLIAKYHTLGAYEGG
ncbi:MAG: response regulator transcription factor [Deltaproteobacteria bacterium]|nr:response regulator transcription factor [Deltaproteobacteria bacterium]